MQIVIETFRNFGEPSSNTVRVRPLAGQLFTPDWRIWCSVSTRETKKIGNLFVVEVSVVHVKNGSDYLRIDPRDDWTSITRSKAEQLIRNRSNGSNR